MKDDGRTPRDGLHVAFLSGDGLCTEPPNDSLIEQVASGIRATGRRVEIISWKNLVRVSETKFPREELVQLWLRVCSLYLTGASYAGAEVCVPCPDASVFSDDPIAALGVSELSGMKSSSILSAAWAEVGGFLFLHDEVVKPLLAQGTIVLQESIGFKNLVKRLTMAREVDPEAAFAAEIGLTSLQDLFGTDLAPDLGIHLSYDTDRVADWREHRGVAPAVFESFPCLQVDSHRQFRLAQKLWMKYYREFAEQFDWTPVDISAVPIEQPELCAEQLIFKILRRAK